MDERCEIYNLLPDTLPEDIKNAMLLEVAKYDVLGAREFMVFQRESWSNSFDEEIYWSEIDEEIKPKWAASCTCGICGEQWHWGWKNQHAVLASVGLDGMVYPGIPDGAEETQEIDEQDLMVCPYCGNQVIAVSRNSLKNGRTYRCMMGRVENLGQYTAVVFWMLERVVNRNARSDYNALPWAAIVIGKSGRIYRFSHTTAGMYGKKIYWEHWTETPRMGEPINSRYYSWEACNKTMMGGFYLMDVPDQAGQSGEKTGIAEYMQNDGEYPLAYLLRQKQRPVLENLVKAGWTYTIDCAIDQEIHGNARWGVLNKIADWSKVKPKEMLRMPKDAVIAAGRWHWDQEKAALWQELCGTLDVYTYNELVNRLDAYEVKRIVETFGAEHLPGIIKYLEHQARRYGGSVRERIGTYIDYRRMLAENGGGATEIELYPPNLRAAHNRHMNIQSAKKNSKLDAQFSAICEKWAALEWTDGSICAVLPRKSADLTAEGRTLNHCVGGYANKHIKGEIIIFIRHARRPERSWYTLNVDLRAQAAWYEVQLHGYGNEYAHGKRLRIPQEVRAFVDRWEKEVLTPVFRRIKASEKKADKNAGAA